MCSELFILTIPKQGVKVIEQVEHKPNYQTSDEHFYFLFIEYSMTYSDQGFGCLTILWSCAICSAVIRLSTPLHRVHW